jgi:hypothetical protein
MGIVRDELHTQVEACGLEQTPQRGQSRLAPISLISRDHCPRNTGTLGKLRLAQATLDPGELQ